MLTVASCASETLSPFGYFFSSSSARTVRPVSVVVAAMSSTIVRKLRRGFAAPVDADEREKPVLDLVPLAGSRRQVAHRDRTLSVVSQLLESSLPQTDAIARPP